jgi:hypothetical protein
MGLTFKDLVEGLVRGQELIEQQRRKRDEKRQKEASDGNDRRTTQRS